MSHVMSVRVRHASERGRLVQMVMMLKKRGNERGDLGHHSHRRTAEGSDADGGLIGGG